MTVPVAVLLLVLVVAFLMTVREAVLFYRWLSHLRRVRSDHRSPQGLSR
jgi:hypothetical protein